jgi:hypothetical protein
VHVTVIGVVPEATLLIHPGILLLATVKVTFPATDTSTERVVLTPFDRESATVRVTLIGVEELLVMVREVI